MSTHDFKGRLEDRRYITGTGSYTGDRNIPGQLHAFFLRSDRPHAEILSVDTAEARAQKGVQAILTGEDIAAAGLKPMPVNAIAGKSRDGTELIKTVRPALAQGRVRFVGEAVACIANFTPVPRPGYRVGLPWAGEWQVLLDSDSGQFGGSGYRGSHPIVSSTTEYTWQGQPASAEIDIPPLGVVWLGAVRP